MEGDGGKEVMSDGAFLAEGPFLVPCCGDLGLNELFNVGGGRGHEVRDKRVFKIYKKIGIGAGFTSYIR